MIKVSLSFDDGREDNYRMVKEILEPLNIPATFNITTGYIQQNLESKKWPCNNSPMNKENVISISKNPLFELAGHGYEHQNEFNNLAYGLKELKNWCALHDRKMGIASPCSQLDKKKINDHMAEYKKIGVDYIRVGDHIRTKKKLKVWLRRLNRFLNFPRIYYWIYKESMTKDFNSFFYYSIPVLKCNSYREIIYLIEKAIKNNESCILMFHSILKNNEKYYNDLWTWDYCDFKNLCLYLKEKEETEKVKLCKTIDLKEK